MTYDLRDLVDDKNTALHEHLATRIDISLEDASGELWTSKLSEGVAYIGVGESDYPTACFAHELLHMKLELDGMVHPQFIDDEGLQDASGQVQFFYNQLAHHRMYPEFAEMGYPPEQFLHDSDPVQSRRLLKEEVSRLERQFRRGGDEPLRGRDILVPYLSLLRSPHDESTLMSRKGQRLVRIADSCFLNRIDRVLETWVVDRSLDCCLSLARLFKLAGFPGMAFSPTGSCEDLIKAREVEIP